MQHHRLPSARNIAKLFNLWERDQPSTMSPVWGTKAKTHRRQQRYKVATRRCQNFQHPHPANTTYKKLSRPLINRLPNTHLAKNWPQKNSTQHQVSSSKTLKQPALFIGIWCTVCYCPIRMVVWVII